MHEKVFFANNAGDTLCGILSFPKGAKTTVIMCHGFSSSKESRAYTEMQKALDKKGIASLRMDFFGHGESEGKMEEITVSQAKQDIFSATKFLKQKGFSRIGLFGTSFGGIASIMAASQSKALSFLVLRCPVSDYLDKEHPMKNWQDLEEWKQKGHKMYSGWMGKKHRINYSMALDFQKNNGYKAGAHIHIPTLILHGTADTSVPFEQSKKLFKKIKNSRLVLLENADHFFSKPEHFHKMLETVTGFISENSIC